MDSNFSVKITADISELQSRLKSVEAVTQKFQQTMNNAATSTKNLEQSANRGRLVAFAFGQVIRDAGFFSQSFALGILAISNNIPILVDQLAQMANLSEKAMSAVSLLGSALTAGLTIYAYYAQSIKDANAEYNKAIQNATKSAESQKSTIQSLVSIAQDETLSYKARKQAVDELNKSVPQLNNSLTVQNANSREQLAILNKIPQAIELQAKAQALATLIGEEYARSLKAQTDSLEDQASIFAKAAGYFQKFIMGNQAGAAFLLAKSGADEFSKTITSTEKNIKTYREQQDAANKKLAEMGFLTDGTKGKTSEYSDALKELSDELKRINADTSLTFSEKNKALVDAYKSAIDSLATIGTKQASSKILELRDAIFKLNQEIYKSEGNKFAIDLFTKKTEQDAKDTISELDNLNNTIQQGLNTDKLFNDAENMKAYMVQMGVDMANIMNQGVVSAIGNAMLAIGEAFATGGNVAAAFGAGILASLSSVLSQLADKLIAAGVAGMAFSSAMKNLFSTKNWAIALAAGVALKVAAGAAGGFARSLSGGGGSMGGGMGASPTPSFGGLSNITANTGMNASSSIASTINAQPVLETRISGNDLVILMNRSSNTRNSYY